jgi:hypothetical protein
LFLRITVIVVLSAVFLGASSGLAVAQTDEDRVRMCLAGDLAPRALVAAATFGSQRYELNCGSPISYGVLHIDDDHPVDDARNFIACFRRMVTEAGPAAEDLVTPYFVRKMNLVLGVSKGVLVYEPGGNIQTMYTTGLSTNMWLLCATASPLKRSGN